MKILFIDDENNQRVQSIFERLSEILGHTVILATTAEEALIKFNTDLDLAIIDQVMPNKTGLELGLEISDNPEFQHIPLVMLTATDSTKFAVPALTECGFSYFIAKENFTGKKIEEVLIYIEKLPSVQIKRKLRTVESRIAFYMAEIDRLQKGEYIKRFDEKITTKKNADSLKTIERRLDNQERILEIIASHLQAKKKSNSGVSIMRNMFSLAGGMMLLEQNIEPTPLMLSELSDLKNHPKYGFSADPKANLYHTFSGYFKAATNGKTRKITLIVIGLIKNNNPDRWKRTIDLAEQKKSESGFHTYIDKIIEKMNE